MSDYRDEDVTAAFMALIASGGNYAEASRFCATQGIMVPESTLRGWATDTHGVRYQKLREEWAPRIEGALAEQMLDNARAAAEVERMAIEAARAQLEDGSAKEPAKIARDLSQVKSQSVDKRLALQGRPTQVTENRGINEIVTALQGMKVAVVVQPGDKPAELPENAGV